MSLITGVIILLFAFPNFCMNLDCLIPKQSLPIGAYIHIPFCRRRCYYCDFPIKVVGDRKDTQERESSEYTDILLREIHSTIVTNEFHGFTSLYFGGGTPSLMRPLDIDRIISLIDKKAGLRPFCEITLECDPASFDRQKVRDFKKAGINRVSLGVQSFDDSILKKCGRAHTVYDIYNAIDILKELNMTNISIDLISSLPSQTTDIWKHSLECAGSLDVKHISVYDLQVEDKTAFGRWYSPGVFPLPSEDTAAEMYRMTVAELGKLGYEHYEISNYAKPGHRSQHNQKYWNCDAVYGFGLGAASFADGRRFTRPRTLLKYTEFVRNLEETGLAQAMDAFDSDRGEGPPQSSEEDALLERVMLSLRTADGLDLKTIGAVYGQDTANKILKSIDPFIAGNLVVVEPSKENSEVSPRVRLTDPDGFLMSNDIISSVFAAFIK